MFLHSACITSYGIATLFISTPSSTFHGLWYPILMQSLCLLPHALAALAHVIDALLVQWYMLKGYELPNATTAPQHSTSQEKPSTQKQGKNAKRH